jgi:AbiV
MVTVDVSIVLQGSRLCILNSRRLNAAARTLLDSHGDTGIVFGLWSLAVEELGKAFLLKDQVGSRHPGEFVSVQPGPRIADAERKVEYISHCARS